MLCGPSLHDAFAAREVVVYPFRRAQVTTNSYDVTLGSVAYMADAQQTGPFVVSRQSRPPTLWKGPMGARSVGSLAEGANQLACQAAGLGPEDQVLIVRPGQTLLASTKEFIGSQVSDVAPVLVPRTTLERCFVRVRGAVGTPGFFNRWTLHITNEHPTAPAVLVVGQPVAQVQFWRVENVRGAPVYGGDRRRDKYHPFQGVLVDTVKNWRPDQMLARLDTEPADHLVALPKSEPIPWQPRPPEALPQQQQQQQQQYQYTPPPPPQPTQVIRQPPQAGFAGPGVGGTPLPPPPQVPMPRYGPPTRRPDGSMPLPPALQPMHVSQQPAQPLPTQLSYNPDPPV